jgi:hypothetical protein
MSNFENYLNYILNLDNLNRKKKVVDVFFL